MNTRHHLPLQEPGEVVLASVSNPVENPHSKGKVRPVVLVRKTASHWAVMGLTSKPSYRNGAPRTPYTANALNGLNQDGYLWGDRLTNISVFDLRHHLG